MDKEEYFSRTAEYIKTIRDGVGETAKRLGSFEGSSSMETIYWKIHWMERNIASIRKLLVALLVIASIALIHFW